MSVVRNRASWWTSVTGVTLTVALAASCNTGGTSLAYVSDSVGAPERGRELILEYDCGRCHTIDGIREARGLVGPPLTGIARRTFIAGQLPNSRENLERWISAPAAVEPGTAMPDLGMSPEDVRDVSAYLLTLH